MHAAQASSARIDNAAEVQNTPPESTASPPPVVLVVGASDSCGAAGIAADLRALSGQGCHAALALTAVTAQSGHQVSHIHGVPAAVVAAQCAQAATAFDLGAIKIGMLWSTESVQAVAHFVAAHPRVSVVLDPVLRASAGPALLETGALEALQHLLLSHVTLLTPNLPEAAMLLGAARIADAAHPAAAQALAERFQCSVLLKGGHSAGAPEDLLWHAGTLRRYRHPRLPVSVRGTGCMLASAIAGGLAQDRPLSEACTEGIAWLQAALRQAWHYGPGLTIAGRSVHAGANDHAASVKQNDESRPSC